MTKKKNAISRRKFLYAGAAGAVLLSFGGLYQYLKSRKPNILFIMADDMPPGDLSCYFNTEYQTPNLDKLAKQGLLFQNAYSAVPNCQPTRCAFMTGSYPQKFDIGNKGSANEDPVFLPDVNLATRLREAGYENALFGKWHLGTQMKTLPLQKGFDEFFGIIGGNADYFEHRSVAKAEVLFEGNRRTRKEGYLTDLFTDRAVEFIKRKRERPFFLSLNYNAPHTPVQGPADGPASKEFWKKSTKLSNLNFAEGYEGFGTRESYIQMVKSLDEGVGRVLAALEESGHEQETLVIFTSDNGGDSFGNLHHFRGRKGSTWEGGIRIPTILRWPGVPAGEVFKSPIITMDLTATILEFTGVSSRKDLCWDGVSIFEGERAFSNRKLFWRWRAFRSVRSGQWKYVRNFEEEHLFDLSHDPREKKNLANHFPLVVSELRTALNSWEETLLPAPEADDPSFMGQAVKLRFEENQKTKKKGG